MTDIKQEYDSLLASGMFWEFYPELTGEWVKDQEEFTRKLTITRKAFFTPITQKQWEQKPVCSITEAVKADLDATTAKGYKEYGCTLDREDLSRKEWLEHLYSELLDAAKYIKKAIKMMEDE